MSLIFKRSLSTLIPPKVASASNLGAAPGAQRLATVVEFYKGLPRGPAPAPSSAGNFFERYTARYIKGGNASGAPLVWLLTVVKISYTIDYQLHLKHHKGGEGEEHH
ncbi:ATP synthase subunit F, mitochondrial [Lipomyces oligophaga]|uniref:ATP synthase subunit F, mitochondrial n=1 Tax=Lipomyces oligophaga TaxID=45792 RepID=UPI0034CE61D2